jgi:hypothetical protein
MVACLFQLTTSARSKPQSTSSRSNVSEIVTNGHSTIHDATAQNNVPNQSARFQMPRAPPHVYSCFVVNRTSESIECSLKYDGRSGDNKFDQVVDVIIPANSEHYFPRQIFQPELPESYCKWVKIITHIRVQKANGKVLEVDYPFDTVQCPIRNWEFHVRDDGDILSKPPTRVANLLKYENLNQYEQ